MFWLFYTVLTLAQDCKCILVQYWVKPEVPHLVLVPCAFIHFHYTAMKPLVSTLPAWRAPHRCCQQSSLPAPCCYPFSSLLPLSHLPDPQLHPLATATTLCWFLFLLAHLLLDQSPSRTLTVLVLFLIHEYGVTRMKCVDGILSFWGELCDILHSCAWPWCITNTNHEHSEEGIRLEEELLPVTIRALFLTDSLIIW